MNAWQWKVEVLGGFGPDPDIIDVLHFDTFAEANKEAKANRPSRVCLASVKDPSHVLYILFGKLCEAAPLKYRREVERSVE